MDSTVTTDPHIVNLTQNKMSRPVMGLLFFAVLNTSIIEEG